MRINIEHLKKKESANSINFDYSIDLENLDESKKEESEESAGKYYSALLNAAKIEFIKISGDIAQKNGLVAINYNILAKFCAECARCGKESEQTIETSGERYIAYASDEDEKYMSDAFYIAESGGIIDLNDFINEFLGVEVPFRYLCSEDCKGLCPKCGKDLNSGECSCPKKEKNPKFTVLDDFFEK